MRLDLELLYIYSDIEVRLYVYVHQANNHIKNNKSQIYSFKYLKTILIYIL